MRSGLGAIGVSWRGQTVFDERGAAMGQQVFVLTGAGVSAESGLGTFRDVDGLWTQYDLADVASIDGYRRNPRLVLDFYNARRRNLLEAAPNPAHSALARLEAGLASQGGRLTLVTQNVDDLHEQAGARAVIHMHGSLKRARCGACGDVTTIETDQSLEDVCAACGVKGLMRPDIVWFGEVPMAMDLIEGRLMQADLFVAIGTSGAVYPAAGFVQAAGGLGIPTLELNLAPGDNAGLFDAAHYGPASTVVPAWVASVFNA
jgi:NAD-dependent deacetylase